MSKPSKQTLQQKYDRAARWYDVGETMLGWLGVGRLRRKLLQKASGEVLEVAVGTGKNLLHYPTGCAITAIDLSPEMLNVACERANRLNLDATFHVMDAEALDFPDGSFDTVVSTLSTCTFPDPVKALREMARVCRPGGKVLLLEHGRSSYVRLAHFQDRHAEGFAKPLGCHWNREPLELLRPQALNGVVLGLVVLGVASLRLELSWSMVDVLLAGAGVLGAWLVYGGLYIAFASLTFWTQDRAALFPIAYNLINFGRYPMTIYPAVVRFVLTFVLPYGFLVFYPAAGLLQDSFRTLGLLTPVVGLVVFMGGLALWRVGLARYEGAGS